MTEWLLLAYFAISFLAVLDLGYLQQANATLPVIDNGSCCSNDPCVYSVMAVAIIVGQACITLVCLGDTPWFPLGALFLGFTLLCHHTVIHWNSRFEDESCSCAPFQCKDVGNHETWVVASIVAAVISWLGV